MSETQQNPEGKRPLQLSCECESVARSSGERPDCALSESEEVPPIRETSAHTRKKGEHQRPNGTSLPKERFGDLWLQYSLEMVSSSFQLCIVGVPASLVHLCRVLERRKQVMNEGNPKSCGAEIAVEGILSREHLVLRYPAPERYSRACELSRGKISSRLFTE
jgi:hypothetical protein